jgi:chromosome segregation ATPase
MRPAEISDKQIIEAGQALQAAGRNITGFALRRQIGGGDPARLKHVWDEYSKGSARAEPVAELPVEVAESLAAMTKALTDTLAEFVRELNNKAVKAADARVAEAIRGAAEQAEQAQRELADASQTVEELEATLDEAHARIVSTEAERKALVEQIAELREKNAALVERATAAETRATELRTENAALRMELEKERKTAGELRTENAELRTMLDMVKQHARESREETMKIAKEATELTHIRAKLEADVLAAREEANALRTELERARQDTDGLRTENAELRKQAAAEIEAVRIELARLNATIEAERDRYQQAEQQMRTSLAEQKKVAQELSAERNQARQDAAAACEEAARLCGMLEKMKEKEVANGKRKKEEQEAIRLKP